MPGPDERWYDADLAFEHRDPAPEKPADTARLRALAIHTVLGMAIAIEGEWGGGEEVKAHAEGAKLLAALGVTPDEIPQLVHPSWSEYSYVLPDAPAVEPEPWSIW